MKYINKGKTDKLHALFILWKYVLDVIVFHCVLCPVSCEVLCCETLYPSSISFICNFIYFTFQTLSYYYCESQTYIYNEN